MALNPEDPDKLSLSEYIPQMFLCQNFIPTNGVSLLSNKFKKRSTESQKRSKNSFKILRIL